MIVIEKNEGTKIGYEEFKTSVCFDDDLTINLAKRQKDWAVHIDVCSDEDGALVIGAESGKFYVAQLDIPPMEYEPQEVVSTFAEMGEESDPPVPLPLDMEKVVLTLWALENRAEAAIV